MPGKTLPVEQRTRAELLLFTMIYSKNPLDYEELMKMLKARGLIIADEQKAINSLRVISYFRLANYLRPMEYDKENHLYKPNSYFENAIDLYSFDKEFVELSLQRFNLLRLPYGQR